MINNQNSKLKRKKTIALLTNDANYTYNLRRELIQAFVDAEYRVVLVLPYGQEIEYFKTMGCEHAAVELNGRGLNPFQDAKLLLQYWKIINKIKPDIVLTYTIKANIYGGLIAKIFKRPVISNITGLGTAIESPGILQKIGTFLYRLSSSKRTTYFFQNENNQTFFNNHNLIRNRSRVIPGSGVNTEHFSCLKYPQEDKIIFSYIARVMKEKGIELFLAAAHSIKSRYPQAEFHITGRLNPEYENIIMTSQKDGLVTFHGEVNDVRQIFEISHCIVHPSFYPEGISNILLESAASCRPVITSDRPGCRETLVNGISGFTFISQNVNDLIAQIERFILLSSNERIELGKSGRKHVMDHFSRDLIIKAYLDEIGEMHINC